MVATGGAAVGLLLGGVLTQYAGWRWDFFINVPIGIVIAVAIWRRIPADAPSAHGRRLDAPGAVLVTGGVMAAVLAFSEAPTWGWADARTIASLVAAVVLLGLTVLNESKVASPLIDLTIFKLRNVNGANLMMATMFAGHLGMFFVLTLYLRDVLGCSAARRVSRSSPSPSSSASPRRGWLD